MNTLVKILVSEGLLFFVICFSGIFYAGNAQLQKYISAAFGINLLGIVATALCIIWNY